MQDKSKDRGYLTQTAFRKSGVVVEGEINGTCANRCIVSKNDGSWRIAQHPQATRFPHGVAGWFFNASGVNKLVIRRMTDKSRRYGSARRCKTPMVCLSDD